MNEHLFVNYIRACDEMPIQGNVETSEMTSSFSGYRAKVQLLTQYDLQVER